MRVSFANRLTRFGRGNDEAEAEAGQVVDLNEPVILFPAEHISSHHEVERAWWKKPGVLVASTAIVFVLGAGAGILMSRRAGDGGSSAANPGPFTAEMSALALPDEDLRIAPTARDSGPTAEPGVSLPAASRDQGAGPPPPPPPTPASRVDQPSVAPPPTRQPVPVSAESLGAPTRAEPVPEDSSLGESTAVELAASRSEEEPPLESGRVSDAAVTERPDTRAVAIVTTPAVQLPVPDSGAADVTAAPGARFPVSDAGVPAVARAVPEPPPSLDPISSPADRSAARPALLAGVERLINAINAENGAQSVRPLLLDPVSRREVVKFVRDEKPTAAPGTVDEVQFDGDEATIIVRVGFRWRGSFGIEERETRRFLAVARRDGGEWRFTGVRLTGDLP